MKEDIFKKENTNFEEILSQFVERLDKRDEQWTQTIALLSHVVARQGTFVHQKEGVKDYDEGELAEQFDRESELEEEEEEKSDFFQISVAILIAIISLLGGVLAWRGNLVAVDDADIAGLNATLNAETTQFINNTTLYKRYRAYSVYVVNNKLQQQIETDAKNVPATEQNKLTAEQSQSVDFMATSRLFFPTRYLNHDGSYNIKRDLGEAWAQASQLLDLNPQSHFDEANALRAKETTINEAFVWLAVSMLFFAIAQMLNPAHQILRYSNGFLGMLFLIIATATFIGAEFIA